MHLIEIFLPLADNAGNAFDRAQYEAVERELAARFGGVTAYPRSPASGLWKESASKTQRDELIVYEVMAEQLDAAWWGEYRQSLEKAFRQEKLLMRAQVIEML